MELDVKLLNKDAIVPTYADDGASGFDLYAVESGWLRQRCSEIIRTGLAFNIPEGYEIQIRGRSGLAFNDDIIAHFGTIDSSFKGEIMVKLFNLGYEDYYIKKGDRIAQGVLAPKERAKFNIVTELSTSERGTAGFGHSGK